MREKLIELFRAVAHENCFGSIENIADHLIANGVTLQSRDCYWATEQAYKNGYEQGKKDAVKWIPVAERLPEIPDGWKEHPDRVLYMMKSTKTIYAGYYGEGGTLRDKYFRQYHNSLEGVDAEDVLCWMWQHDLPEPPEENKEGAAYGESD